MATAIFVFRQVLDGRRFSFPFPQNIFSVALIMKTTRYSSYPLTHPPLPRDRPCLTTTPPMFGPTSRRTYLIFWFKITGLSNDHALFCRLLAIFVVIRQGEYMFPAKILFTRGEAR